MALIGTLVDTFQPPTLNGAWTNTSGTATVNGLLNLGDNSTITSVAQYTLTGSSAHIKIVSPGTLMYPIYLYASGDWDIFWQYYGGILSAHFGSPSVGIHEVASMFYGSSMAYVRIRESSGTIYYETSPNGSTWTTRGTVAASGIPDLTIYIYTAFFGASTLDNFNSTSTTYTRSISGAIRYSGSITRPTVIHTSTISGSINYFGNVTGTKQAVFTDVERKTIMYKAYDEDGSYLGLIKDVINDFKLPEELNTAGSAVTLELARNSDTLSRSTETLLDHLSDPILDSDSQAIFTTKQSPNQIGEGSTINYNNRVDVYVFYGQSDAILDYQGNEILDSNFEAIIGTTGAPNGIRLYSGFISDISSRYGTTETTIVSLMSYGWDLDQYVVSSGSNTTVAFNSIDPSDMVKNGVSTFATESGSMISWNTSTIEASGTIVSYTVKLNTYLELLKKSVELAPSDWFFFLDQGTQLINFKDQSSTPDHLFHLGKHIESLDLRGNIENATNDVYFVGGEVAGVPLFKRYPSGGPVPAARTRRTLKRLTDSRVTLSDTAGFLGQGEIDRNNQILYRSTLTILDKKYDIESIKLGQLIGFRNFGNYIDSLELQVVGRTYTPDAVELQLGTLLPKISKRIQDIKRNLEAQETESVPVAPS